MWSKMVVNHGNNEFKLMGWRVVRDLARRQSYITNECLLQVNQPYLVS